MKECPKCGSTHIKKEKFETELLKTDPFAEYVYECMECGYLSFDRNESGKGTF